MGQALAGYRLVNGRYERIEVGPNEHGLDSGYSEALGVRLCSVERSRRAELVAIQPNFVFMEDYDNNAQLIVQDAETRLYILNAMEVMEEYERTQESRQRAEENRRRAEAERASQAEAARLRERLRWLE